jgi:hypothetical protein
MDYEMNLEHQQRLAQVRRLAHKLATNKSKSRVVRKLPQAYTVVRQQSNPVLVARRSLNTYKVAGYAMLIGMALAAFILEFDADTLNRLRESVQEISARSSHLLSRT